MVVNQVLLLLLKPQPYVPAKTFATNCTSLRRCSGSQAAVPGSCTAAAPEAPLSSPALAGTLDPKPSPAAYGGGVLLPLRASASQPTALPAAAPAGAQVKEQAARLAAAGRSHTATGMQMSPSATSAALRSLDRSGPAAPAAMNPASWARSLDVDPAYNTSPAAAADEAGAARLKMGEPLVPAAPTPSAAPAAKPAPATAAAAAPFALRASSPEAAAADAADVLEAGAVSEVPTAPATGAAPAAKPAPATEPAAIPFALRAPLPEAAAAAVAKLSLDSMLFPPGAKLRLGSANDERYGDEIDYTGEKLHVEVLGPLGHGGRVSAIKVLCLSHHHPPCPGDSNHDLTGKMLALKLPLPARLAVRDRYPHLAGYDDLQAVQAFVNDEAASEMLLEYKIMHATWEIGQSIEVLRAYCFGYGEVSFQADASTSSSSSSINDPVPFVLTELAEAGSLDMYIRGPYRQGGLPPNLTQQYIFWVARALESMHAHAKAVHRDLKASNLLMFLDHLGRLHPKLADFNISKLVPDMDMLPTTFAGTPGHMAPEVSRSASLLWVPLTFVAGYYT